MGGGLGCQTLKLQNVYGQLGEPEKPVKPIVLLCPAGLSGINM